MRPLKTVWFDSEFDKTGERLLDIGAVDSDKAVFHSPDIRRFREFAAGADIICGHNIADFDLGKREFLAPGSGAAVADTLYLSALLFPQKRFHHLLKDEKLLVTELNNPVSDAIKARDLFFLEMAAFGDLPPERRRIYRDLLAGAAPFEGFFRALELPESSCAGFPDRLAEAIFGNFRGLICESAPLQNFVREQPVALAFALAVIQDPALPELPAWVRRRFPASESILQQLRFPDPGAGCRCRYCTERLELKAGLGRWFGFSGFRSYAGEPLQERAARSALLGESLIAIFPTGGGKSLAFQLPALMAGEATRGLTVVISPLQSLMKDQVDHLADRGIDCAAAINGLLNPIERRDVIRDVGSGKVKILYISPEQLRSRTIGRLLAGRRIERFVIDEAHCFSAWGHDFRVDYLYIGDFIAELQKSGAAARPIPVSCFTATAKQKVIQDFRDYFQAKLGLEMRLFATDAQRENLHFCVLHLDSPQDKYERLRSLIETREGPVIVYVSSVAETRELADRLAEDGFSAAPYNGPLNPREKKENQDRFLADEIRIIVATNAFGMGVDKPDVRLVVHYNISSSLENYVQEAGRAGRDPSLQAECYVLFSEEDLNRHFTLLTQSKLSFAEISQVWKGVKSLSRNRHRFAASDLELAKAAGWERFEKTDLTTRIRTAVAVLERAGYVRRLQNVPRIYATAIRVKSLGEGQKILGGANLSEKARTTAELVLHSLISSSKTFRSRGEQAESRIDYLADSHGRTLEEIVEAVGVLRELGILTDDEDIAAYLGKGESLEKSRQMLAGLFALEARMITALRRMPPPVTLDLKEIVTQAQDSGLDGASLPAVRLILKYWRRAGLTQQAAAAGRHSVSLKLTGSIEALQRAADRRRDLASWALDEIGRLLRPSDGDPALLHASFSLVGLVQAYGRSLLAAGPAARRELESVMLFLHESGALHMEGGFFVSYQRLTLERLVTDNKRQFRKDDYRELDDYYRQKVQQIHIVGEFANLMVRDSAAAMAYVRDYFALEYKAFIGKYFRGGRSDELRLRLTASTYRRIFGELSERQLAIVEDEAQFIAVAAGPGSGKTRVLVHKLASLLVQEDVKPEQLLMLTFSRAAATVFKSRLIGLIGKAAHFAEIRTFHSFCFDVLGRYGSLADSDGIIRIATEKIRSGQIDPRRIAKTVLVLDEAQDLDEQSLALVEALIGRNEVMRVIAVGDDDQNIFQFRGADTQYFRRLIAHREASFHEMTVNYRSARGVVALANAFAGLLHSRLKSGEIRAARQDEGLVSVTEYAARGTHLAVPVARDLCARALKGTSCVLTQTNEEAAQVASELRRRGIPATLVQSQRDVNPFNMLETRWLLWHLKGLAGESPLIAESVWERALEDFRKRFSGSAWLHGALRLCRTYRETAGESCYLSDLEEFFRESRLEDLYETQRKSVFVSTIHKAKGREFDNVWLMLSDARWQDEGARRAVYVGLTRACSALMVHCRGSFPARGNLPAEWLHRDESFCRAPEELLLPLGLSDVYLDFFIGRKHEICSLACGEELIASSDGKSLARCSPEGLKPVIVFSGAFVRRLGKWLERGYRVQGARVSFILAWTRQGRDEADAAALADLLLGRPADP